MNFFVFSDDIKDVFDDLLFNSVVDFGGGKIKGSEYELKILRPCLFFCIF